MVLKRKQERGSQKKILKIIKIKLDKKEKALTFATP
jgi:hypothetical protein